MICCSFGSSKRKYPWVSRSFTTQPPFPGQRRFLIRKRASRPLRNRRRQTRSGPPDEAHPRAPCKIHSNTSHETSSRDQRYRTNFSGPRADQQPDRRIWCPAEDRRLRGGRPPATSVPPPPLSFPSL